MHKYKQNSWTTLLEEALLLKLKGDGRIPFRSILGK